ncbi:hypothetical protein C8R44DRAFT_791496 [Mycena epipterygia]|nr:hypothetical protein C8R44DRAFT_791496 [Mycena epipterygia]
MHRCLRIPEIVAMICVHLDPHPEFRGWPASKQPWLRDFAAVTRTCVDLYSPSLDSLWRSATLENLLLCMSSDVWALNEPA